MSVIIEEVLKKKGGNIGHNDLFAKLVYRCKMKRCYLVPRS